MKFFTSIKEVPEVFWDTYVPLNPFLSRAFFEALENSRSIGPESGWVPIYIYDEQNRGLLFSFIKSHSYGEYIFDWEWARAYQQYGRNYYPKLTSMLPFTPATTPHFLLQEHNTEVMENLLTALQDFYQDQGFSSSHFLFISENEKPLFEKHGHLIRESFQYHFINSGYQDFQDFLQSLKGKKAKVIRKERVFPGITIKQFTGDSLTQDHAHSMYQFYRSTIDEKGAIDYLKEGFFIEVFEKMRNNILYVEARDKDSLLAGSLFFYDKKRLYGRYWGSHQFMENLHFELCYYQGIDFCLRSRLEVFEAGAQGEHKIARGFIPTRTYSAHQIKGSLFSEAISNFIQEEKKFLSQTIDELKKLLPFK